MTYSSDVLALSPDAYLRLADLSATTMADSSGNARDGSYTDTGSITYGATGIIGAAGNAAVTFAGVSGNFGSIADAAWMDRTANMGVGVWFKTTNTGNNYMIQRWGSTSGTQMFGLDLQSSNVIRGYYRVTSNRILSATVTGLRDGNYHFAFINYDGSNVRLYVDGVEVGTAIAATGSIQTGAADIRIAQRTGVTTDLFNGTLDEVYIGPSLTAPQIAALYASGSAGAKTGTASGTYDFSGTATGKKPTKGTASGAYAFNGTAAGKSPNKGTASGTYDFTGSATGVMGDVPTEGTASGTYDFSGTATGEADYEGTAAGAYAFGGAATGSSPNKGTASGGYDFTGTAEGDNSLIPSGEATGTYNFAGTAAGSKPFIPDTTHLDRAAGMRYRTGGGHAIIAVPVDPEPEVVAEPVSAITTPVWIATDTIPMPSADADGLLEPVEATTFEDDQWGRFRVTVGNRDVTFFRGIPMPQPTYQLTDPYGWGPATIDLPSVFFTEVDAFGEVGDLRWLRKGAPVVIHQVVGGEVESVVWRGEVDAPNVTSLGTIQLECSGALSGVLAKRWRPQDLTRGTADLSFLLSVAVEGQLARSYDKAPGWYTTAHDGRIGIEVSNYEGGMTWLAYTDKLLGEAITPVGDSWTMLPNEDDEIDLVERDLDTVAATIYLGGRGVAPALVDDSSESPNQFYAEGVDPDGSRWRNAFYPQTTAVLDSDGELVVPDYPFNDNRTFGLGTTNADTDTGDGILVLQNELIGSAAGFRLLDRGDTYNAATVDAVARVQRQAGLTATGNMNPATWDVLMGDAASTWSLGQAIIRPLVSDPATERFLYNQNGSVIGRNPAHDRSVRPVARHINLGPGVTKQRGYLFCLREYNRAQRAQWRGTITLTSDVIAGSHQFGDAGTAMSRLDLRPGMNVRVKHFGSTAGFVMHVASINVSGSESGPTVTLTVDCQGRPAVDLAAILQRDIDSRGDFARRAFLEHTRGAMQSEAIIGASKEDGFGIVRRTRLTGATWNEIKVIGGQSGTLQGIKLQTYDDPAASAILVTARGIGTARLNRMVPEPLALVGPSSSQPASLSTNLAASVNDSVTALMVDHASRFPGSYPYAVTISPGAASEETVTVNSRVGNTLHVTRAGSPSAHTEGAVVAYSVASEAMDPNDPTEVWTTAEVTDLLYTQRWGLYLAGTGAQPCGYFPKHHTGPNGNVTDHPITGLHEDGASAAFWTLSLRSPWLYLYVWPDRDCYIDGGDDGGLLIQVDEGA